MIQRFGSAHVLCGSGSRNCWEMQTRVLVKKWHKIRSNSQTIYYQDSLFKVKFYLLFIWKRFFDFAVGKNSFILAASTNIIKKKGLILPCLRYANSDPGDESNSDPKHWGTVCSANYKWLSFLGARLLQLRQLDRDIDPANTKIQLWVILIS